MKEKEIKGMTWSIVNECTIRIYDTIKIGEDLAVTLRENKAFYKTVKENVNDSIQAAISKHGNDYHSVLSVDVDHGNNEVADLAVIGMLLHCAHKAMLDAATFVQKTKNIGDDFKPFKPNKGAK